MRLILKTCLLRKFDREFEKKIYFDRLAIFILKECRVM